MVAIVTGQGFGLERSSALVLGSRGQVGRAALGRDNESVYVNAANGNLVITRQDEFLIGRGPDAAIGRTYNSQTTGDGDNADGWRASIYRRISGLPATYGAAGSTVKRFDWDGSDTIYTWNAAENAYVATDGAGAHDKLTGSGGIWTWTDGNSRVTELYDESKFGLITSTSDTDGNTLTYTFNAATGQLNQVVVLNGGGVETERVDLVYDGTRLTRLLTTKSDGTLTRVHYGYETYGAGATRLTSVEVDLTPENGSIGDGVRYLTTYTYASNDSTRVASISQQDGSLLQIDYMLIGSEYRVTRLTETVSSGVTRVTGLFYDIDNRVTTITDPLGGQTVMTYDVKGNLTQLVLPVPAPGATAPTTSFVYNANGDVELMTENGRTTAYSYDASGNMTLSRDAAGNTVRRTYGLRNELLTDTHYLAPDPDGAGAGAAAVPVTTRYAYDPENHLRFAVSAEGEVMEYRYDAPGKLVSTIAYPGNAYNVGSLAWNESIGEGTLEAWVNGIADKSNVRRTDTSYDHRGNVSTVTRYSAANSAGDGLLTDYSRDTYVYDQAGQLIDRFNNASAAIEHFVYDGLGRLVSATDLAGGVTTFAFNDAQSTTTVVLANGLTRVAVHNKAGERISLTESGIDIATAVISEFYDGLGRLRKVTDPTGRSTYFLYDHASRKIADITADGAVTEYGYDASHRLVTAIAYVNRLDANQVASLSAFTAGGTGGANAGGGSGSGPVGSNLILNGSFDTPGTGGSTLAHGLSSTSLAGWAKANGQNFEQVLAGQFSVTGTDGAYWLDMDSVPGSGAWLPTGSNLLINGSFDTPGTGGSSLPHGLSSTALTGWSKVNAEMFEQVTSGQFGITGTDGGYWLDMDSIPVSGYTTIGSNLLVNGSFDQSGSYTTLPHGRLNTDLTGWSRANSEKFEQVAAGQLGIIGTHGAYWLDLDSYFDTGLRAAVGPNLLTNGSFENANGGIKVDGGWSSNSIPGWIKVGQARFERLGSVAGVQPSDGSFWLDLDGTYSTWYGGPPPEIQSPYTPVNWIENGSFEYYASAHTNQGYGVSSSSLPAWTVHGGAPLDHVFSGQFGVAATDGDFWLDLDGPAGAAANLEISQTIAGMTAGQAFLLQFDHANRTTSESGSFEVYWNDVLVATISDSSSVMQTETIQVITAAGNNVLRFRATGTEDQAGASLDNVTLMWAPPPSSGGGGGKGGGGGGYSVWTHQNMDVSQTVSGLTAGQIVEVRFDHANRTTAASGSFEVWWNDQLVASIDQTNTTMQTKSYQVAAVAGDNVLRFAGTGTEDNVGASIDKVGVYATEPVITGGNMDISQTIGGRTAGELLELKFDHANRTTAASGSFEVYWNNVLIETITSTSATMQTRTLTVVAVAGSNSLRFKGIGTADVAGASIDNVRLLATQPLPTGGNMDVNQVIPSLSAGKVQLQFNHANRTSSASGSFEVWWNGNLVETITSTGTAMQTKTYLLDAVAGSNTLRFKGTGTADAAGASIDNVRLYATYLDVGGGNMDIDQIVPGLAAGQVMQLQFNHANRTSAASGSFEVWWNGTLLDTVTSTGTAMQTKTYSIPAIAGSNTLRFKGTGTVDAVGASIDNVRLFATQTTSSPPPGAPPVDALAGLRPTAAPAQDAWTWRVYDAASRLIETIDATGAATVYSYDGDSRLVSSRSYANPIGAATIAGFKTTPPTALVLPGANATDRLTRNFYDNDGRVIATLDGAGGLTRFVYDEAGRKIRELGAARAADSGLWETGTLAALEASVGTSASDRRTDFVYDGRGLLRFAIDATAKPVEYVYDANGSVIRTVDYAGSIAPTASYSLGYVTAQIAGGLGANAANRIGRTVYDAAGRAAFSIDPSGAVSAFAYDNVGRLIKQTAYAATYGVAGDQSLATMLGWAAGEAGNAGNRISRIVYDAAGRIAYQVDAEGYVTEHQHDTAGRVTKDIRYAAQYSVADGVTKTSLAAQIGPPPGTEVTVLYGHDAAGRLTDVTDGAGATTHYVLNGLGQAIDTIVAYNSPDASTTRRTFDADGRVISETRGFGTASAATTGFAYDRLGNVLTVTDARGHPEVRTYDSLGRVLTTRVQVDGDAGNDLVTTNEYDAFGNLVRANDARLNDSFVYYDMLGRAWLRIDAEGYATRTVYSAFGEAASVTRYYLRPSGTPMVAAPPTIQTHARDATTAFGYDKNGRLVSVTDAEAKDEAYVFNSFGDRTKVRNKLGAGLLPTHPNFDSFAVTYTFDKLGRVLSETSPVPAQTEGGAVQAASITTSFEYDSRGNRTKLTEASGLAEQRVTLFSYDKANRLTQTTYAAIPWVADNLATVTTEAPSDYFTYDLRGNLIRTITGKTATVGGSVTHCYYDALGRKTDEVGATGALSQWTYDGNGNLLTAKMFGDAVAIPGAAGGTPPAPVNASNYRLTSHSYDRANRLTGSTVASLRLGGFNGTSYVTYVDTVATSRQYDKGGNLVLDHDGVGHAERWFYDKLGRTVAKVDREDFLTVWVLDSEGNSETETRYASRVSSPPAVGAPVATLIGLAGGGNPSADRTTAFTYDRNGRRLTETRLNVAIGNVSGSGVASATADAPVIYTYNGLGLVTSKTEANGDVTHYEYDNAGRLTRVKDPAITDHAGLVVRRATETFYDGLGNVVRSEVNKEGGAAAEDRVTQYQYGAGGRLLRTTDAMGSERHFEYDAAGRVVKERFLRARSDGTSVEEAIAYRYDPAGRVVTQAMATKSGATWLFGDAARIRYNTFGEVTGRGITGGPDDAPVYQETFDYDAAGRLWRSTGGDGTAKLHVHDRNGAVTLTIASSGTDLAGDTIDAALDRLTNSGANAVGAVAVAGVTATIFVQNRRGEVAETREPFRELSAGNMATIVAGRTYNAFGEVASETDARGYVTDYSYNSMGRLIQRQAPTVSWTGENGVVASARPTETYFYDICGRLVGMRDANKHGTAINSFTRVLLAGTGHGGTEALVTAEYHPDDGVARTFYDVFGEARIVRNELHNSASVTYNAASDELRTYDKLGRVTQVTQRGGLLVDNYSYDSLGRRTGHWNSWLGAGNVERTDYDAQGRVVSQVAFGGDVTTTSYAWSGTMLTAGLGTFGGWTVTTTYANARASVEESDIFGHLVSKRDLGWHTLAYTYDKAGRMVSQATDGETLTYGYYNTGQTASISNGAGHNAAYGYDIAGNRTSDWTQKGYVVVQNATAQYDALNRITLWTEAGNGTLTSGSPPASIAYEYDLNGNIRRQNASYRSLDMNGVANGAAFSQDHWFSFDSMNRVVVDQGFRSGSTIAPGAAGTLYSYDVAGRRATATTIRQQQYWILINESTGQGHWVTKNLNNTETFVYRSDGALSEVWIALDTYDPEVGGGPQPGVPQLRASYGYDNMQRVTSQTDWIGNGTNAGYQRTVSYNAKGQIGSEYSYTKRVNDIYTANTTNNYGVDYAYALGSVTSSTTTNHKNSSLQSTVTTTNAYTWWDGAVQALTQIYTDYPGTSSGDTNYTTTYNLTATGQLASAYIGDGRPRTVTFTTDMSGQIIRRDEADGNTSGTNSGDPHEIFYRFGGKQVGYTGNNGTLDTDYLTSIENRTVALGTGNGAFRNNSYSPVQHADFAQSMDPINSYDQGSPGGGYTVRAGDSLQSIAQQMWGDASLWYTIAEANGLGAGAALVEGQSLILPAGAFSNRHAADTFQPYDSAKAIGDLSPTAPKPYKKPGGCGVVGQIIATVIAVAVSRLIPIPIVGPVLGNLASQAFLIGIGQQSKFNWKSVGIAALTAGLTHGLEQVGGPVGSFMSSPSIAGSQFVGQVAQASAVNLAVQGISVATGLQKKFDWTGVAAAGVGAGIGHLVGGALGARPLSENGSLSNVAANIGVSAAKAVAHASLHSLVDGTSFGDNLIASLPDVIGNTVGELFANGITGTSGPGGSIDYDGDGIISGAEQGDSHLDSIAEAKDFHAAALLAAKEELAASIVTAKDGLAAMDAAEASDAATAASAPAGWYLGGGVQLAAFSWPEPAFGGGIAGVVTMGASAAAQTPLTREEVLLRAEVARDWAALTPEERAYFSRTRQADEHRAVHDLLYRTRRLPGAIYPDELMALGARRNIAEQWARPLSDAFARYGVISREQRAAFVGQMYPETWSLTRLDENLNYPDPNRILRVFGRNQVANLAVAQRLAGHPQALANHAYRASNGNRGEASGDGWNYRGRGFIQVTGRDNYFDVGYGNNPNLLMRPDHAAWASLKWWDNANLTSRTTTVLNPSRYESVVTRTVNARRHAADVRERIYRRALNVLHR